MENEEDDENTSPSANEKRRQVSRHKRHTIEAQNNKYNPVNN
jgi:hypothetical protein